MKLDLSEMARTAGMRYRYEVNEPCTEAEGLVCAEPVRGVIDFANTGRSIIAKGEIKAVVQLECSRCLKSFTIPVSAEILEQFQISGPIEGLEEDDEELDADMEVETERVFVDNILDLTELIRQNLITEIPIRPLCKEACKGLCPACGQNMNDAQCECETITGSEAFASLAEMWKARNSPDEIKDE